MVKYSYKAIDHVRLLIMPRAAVCSILYIFADSETYCVGHKS